MPVVERAVERSTKPDVVDLSARARGDPAHAGITCPGGRSGRDRGAAGKDSDVIGVRKVDGTSATDISDFLSAPGREP